MKNKIYRYKYNFNCFLREYFDIEFKPINTIGADGRAYYTDKDKLFELVIHWAGNRGECIGWLIIDGQEIYLDSNPIDSFLENKQLIQSYILKHKLNKELTAKTKTERKGGKI